LNRQHAKLGNTLKEIVVVQGIRDFSWRFGVLAVQCVFSWKSWQTRMTTRNDQPESLVKGKRIAALKRCGEGVILGTLAGMILSQFGIATAIGHLVALSAGLGGIVSLTRARLLLRALASVLVVAYFLIAYVPITGFLTRRLVRQDPLKSCPAVVVLGSLAFNDQTLSSGIQDRLVTGYTILRQGYAPRLILTRPYPPATPWDGAVRRQMEELKLDYPLDVVGPVHDTHDEAVAIAQLAQERGWHTVILVTHPWHMRRAAAAFEKAGLHVICAPCAESGYDFTTFDGPGDRLAGFRNWLHEGIGYLDYRWRGWV
jgi:uncharacterized SAM-binding protein YcdF (DUF218 family)